MDLEYSDGLMVQDMKVNGKIIKLMEKESFITLIEMFLKESGLMIKLMDMGYICIQMELSIKGIGKMIYKMGMELKYGLTGLDMRDTI